MVIDICIRQNWRLNHNWDDKQMLSIEFFATGDSHKFGSELITSLYVDFTYIETLWKVVKWSMKWPMEMFCSRHTFFLWPYVRPHVRPLNIRWRWCTPMCHWLHDITLSSIGTFKEKLDTLNDPTVIITSKDLKGLFLSVCVMCSVLADLARMNVRMGNCSLTLSVRVCRR